MNGNDTGPSSAGHSLASSEEGKESKGSQGGLWSGSFLGLLVTQFLGAVNDNVFRWLVVSIGKYHIDPSGGRDAFVLSAGASCFVLPYLVLANPAGQLANRFSKRTVIIACKAAEIVLMLAGVLAIWIGNVPLLFVIVALMGAQSALFSPSKLGSIPEMLRPEKLSAGNGLMGLTTVLAVVAGTAVGYWLADATGADGRTHLWISAAVLWGVAAVGLVSSLFIGPLAAADPSQRFTLDIVGQTIRDLRLLGEDRAILRVAMGTAFFWSLGSLAQLNVDVYGQDVLHLAKKEIGPLMGLLAVGVGTGSVLAGIWSGRKVELGIVPLGASGIALGSMLLFTSGESYGWTATWLVLLGLSAGLFDVPLAAYLQHHSPPARRGTILAAGNFVTFGGILVVSGVFYLLKDVWALDATTIFLIAGVGTLPVALYVFLLVPGATIRFVVWLASHTVYRVRVHGRDNLPERGGALLVANHVTWIDGILLLISSSRPLRMLAYAPYVGTWPVRWLARTMGVIPIDPAQGPKGLLRSLQSARQAIEAGDLVCIFAEGQMTRTGQIQPFRAGFRRIIEGTGAPLVPVYLDELWGSIFSFQGGRYLWKWPRRWPYRVSILFGRPVGDADDVEKVRQSVQSLGVEAVEKRKHEQLAPPRSFVRQCRKSLRRAKVADADGAPITGGSLLAKSLILARLLEREVLAPDEGMVGVLLPPSIGAVLANAAIPLLRRVPVNLNYTLSQEVINSCIKQCGIRHVLTSQKVLDRAKLQFDAEPVFLKDLLPRITRRDKLISGLGAYALPAAVLERLLGLHRIASDDLLTVIFTSGSTGEPKGVMLTHHNVASNIESIEQIIHLTRNDVVVGVLPFFHSYGYTVTLWTVLSMDPMGVYHYNPLDGRGIGALCGKYRGTILMATPTFLRTYLRRCEPEQLSNLHVVFAGAEKLPADLIEAFHEKFGVRPREAYGATELAPLAAANVPDYQADDVQQQGTKEGTVGRPIPNVLAKIVDLDTGKDRPTGEPGMLLIQGPNVMKGYLGRPDLTAQVLRDGWYVTGDVATIDADGFITITGRESRFSKIGGEMVPHIKVEETIARILGDQSEIQAVVTAVPDPKKGERLVVVHRPLPKTPEQICKELADAGLANLWIPGKDSFLLVDEIPVLGTGKVDLKRVQALAVEKFG